MLSYLKQLKHLINICVAMNLKLEYVGKGILKDYIGMNSGAAAQMGFKMPTHTIYVLRGLDDKIKLHTLLHEMIEYKLIKKGMKYWDAHCIALKSEEIGF